MNSRCFASKSPDPQQYEDYACRGSITVAYRLAIETVDLGHGIDLLAISRDPSAIAGSMLLSPQTAPITEIGHNDLERMDEAQDFRETGRKTLENYPEVAGDG